MAQGKKQTGKSGKTGLSSFPAGGIFYYEGSWQSGHYPRFIAHGWVAAEVNYDLKTAKILLHYDGTFSHNTTKTIETKLIDFNHQSNTITAMAETDVVLFKSVSQKQNLEFTAKSLTPYKIEGTYKSISPMDEGSFDMHAVSKERFQELQALPEATSYCVIM